jgi:hypothetical protein
MEKQAVSTMKPTSILLSLVVVLGFVSEAGAERFAIPLHDYRITIGDCKFGFVDGRQGGSITEACSTNAGHFSKFYFGRDGEYAIPFTATQGLIGFCVIVVGMAALVTVGTFGWKRKRVS